MKWEYLEIQLPTGAGADNEGKLNNLGYQGWELVTVSNHRAYLKRDRQRTVIPAENVRR